MPLLVFGVPKVQSSPRSHYSAVVRLADLESSVHFTCQVGIVECLR